MKIFIMLGVQINNLPAKLVHFWNLVDFVAVVADALELCKHCLVKDASATQTRMGIFSLDHFMMIAIVGAAFATTAAKY